MQDAFFMPRFVNIKNYKTQNLYASPLQLLDNMEILKNQVQKITQDCQKQTQVQNYKTRSIKELEDKLEISFQCDFMQEHQRALDLLLDRYLQSQDYVLDTCTQSQFSKISSASKNLFQQLSVKILLRQFNREGQLLSEQKSERLIIDLRRESKFNQFIEQILMKVNTQTALQTIYLANLLWQKYYPIQQHNYTFQETIEFAQDLIKKQAQNIDKCLKLINFLHFQTKEHSQQQLQKRKNNFNQFLKFLMTTFALIINGYFQNPYVDQPNPFYQSKELLDNQAENQGNDDNWDEDQDDDQGGFALNKGKNRKF